MVAIGFDEETFLIRPGKLAPEMVCLAISTRTDRWLYHGNPRMMPNGPLGTSAPPARTTREAFEWVLQQDPGYGLNVAYDVAVGCREYPELLPSVFSAYDDGRIIDVGLSQQLIDNAHGRLKECGARWGYSLNGLERRILRRDRGQQKKSADAWRIRYRELFHVPLDRWPAEAVDYALEDAVGALRIGDKQWDSPGRSFMKNSPAQARAAWALHLIMCWGVMTDGQKIKELETASERLYVELTDSLVRGGLVRGAGPIARKLWWTKDIAAAKDRMLEVCKAHEIPIKLTKTGFKKFAELAEQLESDSKKRMAIRPEDLLSEDELRKYVSIDEDACRETGDEELLDFSLRSQLHSVLNTHVPDLLAGTRTPIQPRYTTMVETGRTACSKNREDDGTRTRNPLNGFQFQNPKRAFQRYNTTTKKLEALFPVGVGIRECFISRPGTLFADNDYSGLELHTGAQVCLNKVGVSELARELNAGIDPHLSFAASMMGISYEEAKSRKHDKVVKYYRTLAKVANFGFPGGLGVRGLIGFARGYGVKLKPDECEKLRDDWFAKYPEWREYFKWVRSQLEDVLIEPSKEEIAEAVEAASAEAEDGKKRKKKKLRETRILALGTFEQLYVARFRGGCKYTDACNGLFQGLGADVAKLALYEVAKRCYVQHEGSTIYGVRPVGFIHDEILAEVDEERAHEQAFEIADIMVREGNKLLPDVPVRCVPALSKRWCKEAEAVYNREGRLQPYDLARDGRWDVFYDTNASSKVDWAKVLGG